MYRLLEVMKNVVVFLFRFPPFVIAFKLAQFVPFKKASSFLQSFSMIAVVCSCYLGLVLFYYNHAMTKHSLLHKLFVKYWTKGQPRQEPSVTVICQCMMQFSNMLNCIIQFSMYDNETMWLNKITLFNSNNVIRFKCKRIKQNHIVQSAIGVLEEWNCEIKLFCLSYQYDSKGNLHYYLTFKLIRAKADVSRCSL